MESADDKIGELINATMKMTTPKRKKITTVEEKEAMEEEKTVEENEAVEEEEPVEEGENEVEGENEEEEDETEEEEVDIEESEDEGKSEGEEEANNRNQITCEEQKSVRTRIPYTRSQVRGNTSELEDLKKEAKENNAIQERYIKHINK